MSEDATGDVAEDGGQDVPLTRMAHGAGCGCKLSPAVLREALAALPPLGDLPDVLVGHDRMDDAAVRRIGDDLAVVATVDFFTPIVDDPETYGRIAATNALSDVYAMGGTPLFALAVTAFPKDGDMEVLGAILRGGAAVGDEHGCPVLGGHSVDDSEPKYGLAVVGTVHPDRVLRNDAGKAGDVLVLTKPLGTGIAAAAHADDGAPPGLHDAAVSVMLQSNRAAAEVAVQMGLTCATDVTGFGLLGHLRNLVAASGVAAALRIDRVPVLPGVLQALAAGHAPGGLSRNRADLSEWVDFHPQVVEDARAILFDPQTSGGLLLCVAQERLKELIAALGARGIQGVAIGQLIPEPVGRIGVLTPVNRVGASGGGSRTARPPGGPPPPGAAPGPGPGGPQPPGLPGMPGMPGMPPGFGPGMPGMPPGPGAPPPPPAAPPAP